MLNCVYLFVYCRYVHAGELNEEFLMCESLETTIKAVNISEKMDNFFQKNNLSKKRVGSLYTDGAPSSRCKVRFYNADKKRALHIIFTHCVLPRYAQTSKILPEYMKIVLKHVTESVNLSGHVLLINAFSNNSVFRWDQNIPFPFITPKFGDSVGASFIQEFLNCGLKSRFFCENTNPR